MIPCCCSTPSFSQNCVGIDSSLLVDDFSDPSIERGWVPPFVVPGLFQQEVVGGVLKAGYVEPGDGTRSYIAQINWCLNGSGWPVDGYVQSEIDFHLPPQSQILTVTEDINIENPVLTWSASVPPPADPFIGTSLYSFLALESVQVDDGIYRQSQNLRLRITKKATDFEIEGFRGVASIGVLTVDDFPFGAPPLEVINTSLILRAVALESAIPDDFYLDNLRIERSW